MGKPQQAGSPLDSITTNIEHLERSSKKLATLVDDLGSPLDSKRLRQRLEAGRSHSQAVVKDTQQLLKQPFDRSEKLRHEKLASQFQVSVKRLQDTIRMSQQKEREEVLMLEESMKGDSGMDRQSRLRVDSVLQLEGIDAVDAKIIDERNQDIRALETDLEEL